MRSSFRLTAALPVLALLPALLAAPASAQDRPAPRDPAPRDSAPRLPEVGGVLFLSFVSGGTAAERRAGSPSRFDVDRAYITVRSPSSERLGYRVTADIFQQRDSTRDGYYRGWAFRAKFAQAHFDVVQRRPSGLRVQARMGMMPTHVLDHEETHWPRGIAPTAPDQAGYFSTADVGAATVVTLPGRRGEAYVGVLNGATYQVRETDRFKDVAARVTLTPTATRGGMLGTLSVSPWVYKGYRASDFVRGRGTVAPIRSGVQKDRVGVHAGIRDPRLTLGGHLAWRMDGVERADTTRDAAPATSTRTGRLASGYAIVQPLALARAGGDPRLQALLRVDRVTPDVDAAPNAMQVIGGLGWSLTSRGSVWLTYHNQDPRAGSTATDLKALMVQAIIGF
jgi:hypothetical protein